VICQGKEHPKMQKVKGALCPSGIVKGPGEICTPCGIPRRGFRLTAEIPLGKHFTG